MLNLESLFRISHQTAAESGRVTDDSQEVSLSQLYVERDIEPELVRNLQKSADCRILVGDAGSGKTSLLWHVFQRLEKTSNAPLLLRADALADFLPDEFGAALESIRRSERIPTLLIDTADAVLGSESDRASLLAILDIATKVGCGTLVSCRPAEASRYLGHYGSTRIPDRYSESELTQIIETHSRYFYSRAGVRSIDRLIASVQAIVAQGKPVAELASRPLLLRMLFSLYAPNEIPTAINVAGLYRTFWDRRVKTDWRAGRPGPEPGATDCRAVALRAAYLMLQDGVVRISSEQLETELRRSGHDWADVDTLVARGVLRSVSIHAHYTGYEFFHQTFLEHVAARTLVDGHGASAIKLLLDRLRHNPDDYFRLPVLEHLLVVSQTGDRQMRETSDSIISDLLTEGPPHLQSAAIVTYAQLENVSDQMRHAFSSILEDSRLAARYIQATPSSPPERWTEIWTNFKRLWSAEAARLNESKPWSIRREILSQLPRLARRTDDAPLKIAQFLQDHMIATTIEVDAVANVVSLLTVLGDAGELISGAILADLFNRLQQASVDHDRVISNVSIAMSCHPAVSTLQLQKISQQLANSSKELICRARGAVEAALWLRSSRDILSEIGSFPAERFEISGLATWLTDQNEEAWNAVWHHFSEHVSDAQQQVWVRFLWDRLCLHPLDRGDIPSQRSTAFLAGKIAREFREERTFSAKGAIAICLHSGSFHLRVSAIQRIRADAAHQLASEAFSQVGIAGFLLGPALATDLPSARQALESANTLPDKVILRFLDDFVSLAQRVPDAANLAVPFLIQQGAFARVETALDHVELKLRPLPSGAATVLAREIGNGVVVPTTQKRKLAARWAYKATRLGLGVALDFATFEHAIQTEQDPETSCWLAMAMAALSRSPVEVEAALEWGARASTGEAIYSRDKAFEAWLDLIVDKQRSEYFDTIIQTLVEPAPNLKRLLVTAKTATRIMAFDPPHATQIVRNLLTLLEKVGRPVRESFRREAMHYFVDWSEQTDRETMVQLLLLVPFVEPIAGRLILDLTSLPCHAFWSRERVLALADDLRLSSELRCYIPDLFRRNTTDVGFWVLPIVQKTNDYEINVMNRAAKIARLMESTPDTYRNFKEDDLRNIFLNWLDTEFAKGATGETFRFSGKTDILVRVGDTKYPIECKIWSGASNIGSAINQLLGYVAPQDDGAGLIIFNKTHHPSKLMQVLMGIPDLVPSQRLQREWHGHNGCSYVLKHPRDPARKLEFDVLVVNIAQT